MPVTYEQLLERACQYAKNLQVDEIEGNLFLNENKCNEYS